MSRITDELIEDIQKYARVISNGSDMAMDYAQDALAKILEVEGDYDPNLGTFTTWATRVAINAIIDSMRTTSRDEKRDIEWGELNYPDHTDRLQQWMSAQRAARSSNNSGTVKPSADSVDISLPATIDPINPNTDIKDAA